MGRGFSINFPVSSQDILKSHKTSLVLEVIIDDAITLLWTPRINIITEKDVISDSIAKLKHIYQA